MRDAVSDFGFRWTDFIASDGSWNPSSRTVEVASAQGNRYYGVVFKSDNTAFSSLMVLVHFMHEAQYNASISIHELLDEQDISSATLAKYATAKPARSSTKIYTILTDNTSQVVRFSGWISWSHISGHDVLILNVRVIDPSISAQLRNSSLIRLCTDMKMVIALSSFLCRLVVGTLIGRWPLPMLSWLFTPLVCTLYLFFDTWSYLYVSPRRRLFIKKLYILAYIGFILDFVQHYFPFIYKFLTSSNSWRDTFEVTELEHLLIVVFNLAVIPGFISFLNYFQLELLEVLLD
jgi:hypothetical protein